MNTTEQLPTFQQLVDRELSKYDEVIPKIEEIKAELMPLKIQSIDDQNGYEEVAKALRFVVSKRTAIEQKRKELKADSLAFGRAVDARAKEITEMLAPVEEHLKAEKQKIDDQKAEIERQKEIARQQKIRERHDKLISAGCVNIGGEYYLWQSPYHEKEEIPAVNLELLADDDFNNLYDTIYQKQIDTLQRNAEQERIKKEEEERLLNQKRLMDQQMEELRRQQEEINRQKEAAQKQILQIRLRTLEAMGCKHSQMTGLVFYDEMGIISMPELSQFTEEAWDEFVKTAEQRINDKKNRDEIERKEQEERKKAEMERIRKEAEEQAAARLKAQQEEEERLRKEMEQNMSDSDKFKAYISRIVSIEKPELVTKKWNQEMQKLATIFKTYL